MSVHVYFGYEDNFRVLARLTEKRIKYTATPTDSNSTYIVYNSRHFDNRIEALSKRRRERILQDERNHRNTPTHRSLDRKSH